jgi:hypothetical protein
MTTLASITIAALRDSIKALNLSRADTVSWASEGIHREPGDGSDWRNSGDSEKYWMVKLPERYDTAEVRAALHARQPSAAAAWAARCGSCGGRQVPGTRCAGAEGACGEGDGGGPAECCGEWGNRCCACGWAYGVSQL